MHNIKHGGSALISALFITAIAAMIATALMIEDRLLIHESDMVINSDQDYLILQGMQLKAKNRVTRYAMQWINARNQGEKSIAPLSTQLPTMVLNGMVVRGDIHIESGKFNVNDLSSAANQPAFATLLRTVMPTSSQANNIIIAKNMTAWITNPNPISYYLNLHPPYQSAHQQLINISELRLIEGVTPAMYVALKPYITALPFNKTSVSPTAKKINATPLDINSVSAPVLLAYNQTLTLSHAESLAQCRKRNGAFFDIQTFMSECATPLHLSSLNNIATNTQYFLVKITGEKNNHTLYLTALWVTTLQKNNTLKVATIWQEFE